MKQACQRRGVEHDGWRLGSARALAVAVRSSRRRLALSQRALAELAGVSQASIARIEAGRDTTFGTVLAVLAAVGLELVVTGAPVDERPEDSARDTAGRRLPAHLVVRVVDRLPLDTHLRRAYRGGPLLPVRGRFWVYERPYPWPAAAREQVSDGR